MENERAAVTAGRMNVREIVTNIMAASLRRNAVSMGIVLGIDFPEWVSNGHDALAYLFASYVIGVRDGTALVHPGHACQDDIRRAEQDGHPYTSDMQDAMSELALAKFKFYDGRSVPLKDVFASMLYTGTDRDFDGVRAAERGLAMASYIDEYCGSRREAIHAEYAAAMREARDARKSASSLADAESEPAVAAERQAVADAEAAWKAMSPYTGVRPAHMSQREEALYAAADDAWDKLCEAKAALDTALHENCPEYFAVREAIEDEFARASKAAETARDEKLTVLRAEAEAKFKEAGLRL